MGTVTVRNPDYGYEMTRSLYVESGGQRDTSRTQIYAWSHALTLAAHLTQTGAMTDNWRDAGNGRKVRSIVYEIARLAPARPSATERAQLAELYSHLRTWPISDVRAFVARMLTDSTG
jgi:hypothetical protein